MSSTTTGRTTAPEVSKHFTSSILLWMRSDQPRRTGMDYWRGPHSGIIAATPGLEEYRQIHLAEHNPGRWPSTAGVETAIPDDRRIDGIAEVTFENALSPLAGRKQTALAYEDEINVFRRTLLYAGPPGTSRWYDVAPGEKPGSRAVVYLRRRDDVGTVAFHRFVTTELVPALVRTGVLKELRTQVFLPWSKKLWDTPHVAHDNPPDQHLHASVVLGFGDDVARDAFLTGASTGLTRVLAPSVSAIHAYDVDVTLTYVRDGQRLPHPEE
ncbi:strictosidine synthase [Cellulomonas sp. Sa3CUA2]|uniref:Strictosidine synthase n=1 Tax=Cellulomonas avistercoris TaxID=2762242 RepID=A0ABR8QHC5_9CELL|nr:strictosidine synthase [Cellulomonas avistercoris]MBD7919795.1 strictosidine synthase [Cellulomonas avistercoris]